MVELAPAVAASRAPRPVISARRPLRAPAPTRAVAGIPPAVGRLPLGVGPGEPLPTEVGARIGASLGVDISAIRVHSEAGAAGTARALGARAFTVGRNIFLGAGERASDLALMAHEATHVVQQRGAAVLQRATGGPASGAAETEAQRAAAAVVTGTTFQVSQAAPAGVQRLGISDALDYFADKANLIPGFRMFTVVLGVNPVNMSRVERSSANVLRATVELIPGGGLITQALDAYGVFEKVGTWVDEQIRTLGMTGAMIRKAVDDFLKTLGWRDILRLGDVWDRAKRIFTEPITRLINFGKGLVTGILRFIKDAIMRPLAGLAKDTRGWDLLRAVLGQDPITGDPFPRTAETLIGGFMKLIGQEEVWANIKKANAIPRAWAWFQGALGGLLGFVRALPTMFINTLRSLELVDIVVLPRAFAKVIGAFGSFAARFVSWAGEQVLRLLEIIFEVLAPSVMVYIRKAMGAFKTIVANPVGFIGNLVKAGIQGFKQFGKNFLAHLRKSLIEWLTGSLGGANIYIPAAFEIREIIKFVLSVLGLTWANVRTKLVKAVGAPAVTVLEKGFGIVMTLVDEGPAAAWEKIKDELTNLKEMVIGQVMDFVKNKVVEAAITKLLTSLNPAGAFIQAILAIYNTVMFLVERLSKIAQVLAAFIDSIAAIAAGAIGAAANKVESTMAGLLTLVISFLARIAGLGKVSDAVIGVVNKIRAPIDKALDKVVDWIVKTAKSFLGNSGKDAGPKSRAQALLRARLARRHEDPSEVTADIGAVKKELAGSGLTGLELRGPDGQGGFKVLGSASPWTELAELMPEFLKSRSVVMRVSLTLREKPTSQAGVNVAIQETRGEDQVLRRSEKTLLEPLQPGHVAFSNRQAESRIKPGGIIGKSSDQTRIELLTWNTGERRDAATERTNDTHAEKQFLTYLKRNDTAGGLTRRIAKIEASINDSPCTICSGSLAEITKLTEGNGPEPVVRSLVWHDLYVSPAIGTTSASLQVPGWKLEPSSISSSDRARAESKKGKLAAAKWPAVLDESAATGKRPG